VSDYFKAILLYNIFQILPTLENLKNHTMQNEFDAVMQKRTDADLYKILNDNPIDYQPAAFEAAEREFKRRNLSETQITAAKQEIVQKQTAVENRANTPLGIIPKIIAFLFPGFLLILFSLAYKAEGYTRKSKELLRWTLYGLGLYLAMIVLSMLTILFSRQS